MTTQPQTAETGADDSESYRHRYTDEAMEALDEFCTDYPSRSLQRILAEAARLIDTHNDGSIEYYERLDAEIVGRWILGSEWDMPSRYELKNVSLAQEILANYCAVMRCASGYAKRSFNPPFRFLNDEDGLDTYILSERQFAMDSLRYPGLSRAAQALIERSRYRTRLRKHDSARQPQYSRITSADWPDLFKAVETPLQFGTYNRITYGALPDRIQELTDEPFVLVIPCAEFSHLEVSSLTQHAPSRLVLRFDTRGKPVTCETFAGGALRIPVTANHTLFEEIRSHLTVAYVFAEHVLVVDYPWNQMTFGERRIEEARTLEREAPHNPEFVSSTLEGIVPCRFMVNRVAGLSGGKSLPNVWMDDIPF
jgi:hypothetical protein